MAPIPFFSWTIIGAYLILNYKFKLNILGSFLTPFAACLMIISSGIPETEMVVRPVLRSLWLTFHVGTSFIGYGIFVVTFMSAVMYLIQ